MRIFPFFVVLFLISDTYAQLPNSFTEVAKNSHYGWANDIAINSDGIVFLSNGEDGLRAYSFNGSSFLSAGHLYNGNYAVDVEIDTNGIVFFASDSVRAYTYIDTSFIEIAKIEDTILDRFSGWMDMVISSDNIFFIGGLGGLSAYIFNNASFTKRAFINEGGSFMYSPGLGLAVNEEGIVFRVDASKGYGGLKAYYYEDSSLTEIARINDGGSASDVVVSSDGTIFLLSWQGGLRAYSFNDSSIINLAHIPVDIGQGHIALGNDGIIFTVDYFDGLRAYIYDSNSFINTAHINTKGWATDLMIGADGTIFVADGYEGLKAYRYSGYTSISEDLQKTPIKYELLQNFPNPFNPKTTISYKLPLISYVQLSIYNIIGQKVDQLVSKKQSAGTYNITWDGSTFGSGVYFYSLSINQEFSQTRKLILMK